MKHILYNPHSGNGRGLTAAERCRASLDEACVLTDMTAIADYASYFASIAPTDGVVICGGDGTLNRFLNDVDGLVLPFDLFYFPGGTGNDFAADVGMANCEKPFLLNGYLKNLPTVTVNGKTHKFINGVGFGIDGYCCEVGDKLHAVGKEANYTAIAIKGLLFHFKPVNATVTVDGKEYTYEHVWIAPTMHGRRYGGGMIPTPDQVRDADDPTLSLMVFHGRSKLGTLMIFPSIFSGKHVEKKKHVAVHTGKEITVRFDRPTPLQIDGETILGVTEYSASAAVVKSEILA